MSEAQIPQVPARSRVRRPVDLIAIPVAAVVLLAAVLGGLSPYVAVAVAVGITAGIATARLVRFALAIHAAQRSFGPCRGAGYLGMGALATGLTAVGVPLTPPATRATVAFLGLSVAVAMYLLGMLLLPGAALTVATRLRRGFDGVSLAASLAFAGWVMLPRAARPPLALAAILIAAGSLSIFTVTALRAVAYRPAARICGAGAGLTVLGLAGLVTLLVFGGPPWPPPLAAAALCVGLALTVSGARRADPVARPPAPGAPEAHLSAYPVLTLPAVVAVLAAIYHVARYGGFDRTSSLIGLAAFPTVVVREVLAVVDIRRYARRLLAQEAHFRSLVSGANDLILVVGEDLLVRWQSPAAARLFGLSDAEVVGRPFADLMHPEDAADVTAALTRVLHRRPGAVRRSPLVTARLRDGYGNIRETESAISDQRAVPEVAGLVVHVRDVGERLRLERTLHQLSSTDQLTGLANRRELMRAIVSQRAVAGHTGAVLVVDLHGLAGINDARGRAVGDAVLVEAGRRLQASAGRDDVVARLAGDEFAVLTVDGPMLAYALGTRLVTTLTEPYRLPGAIAHLQVSIGLAELSGGDDVDDVLRRADLARRRARQLGRNRVEWYDSYLEEQLVRRLDIERELPGAVARGELDLVYQPVIGLHDRQPVGTEALLRWRSPVLGTVLPDEVISAGRQLGLVEEIGQWVLHTACRQLARWSEGGRKLWMSVNVLPDELAAPGFVSRVAETVAAHGLANERLVVEIAEPRLTGPAGEPRLTGPAGLAGPAGSAEAAGLNRPAGLAGAAGAAGAAGKAGSAGAAPNLVTQLAGLRALGVRTALDDFGSGQTSLVHLRRLPMDFVKVDRLVVADHGGWHGQGRPLIDVVVKLGRRLGLEIIAEGLESTAQIEQARAAGCRYGQGFALSRPAPAERVEAYLEEFPKASR